ncbi:uncharacterized protein LOC116004005 [Ipomoea triloba]|uniref:uncharacterized protein LOC116004005 n=1 Tax=Ipomoea triloba TaxID=35885 RepID=UPI00125E673E|nr:uncharacterized protein LOC116004005 [Ipomoea triloba]
MNCLFWNCQGAGGREFHRVLNNLIQTHKPSILGLVEPKVSGSHANSICMKLGYSDWIRVEAVGFSGGIWVLWNDARKISVVSTHPQFILLEVRVVNQADWHVAVVYGSPTHHLRRRLWTELSMAKQGVSGPWVVAGDFNAVVSRDETSNYNSFSSQRCSDFVDWIAKEGLVDMGFNSPKLTWSRGNSTGSAKGARLDRVLCITDWWNCFSDATVTHLPRLSLDHTPILLQVLRREVTRRLPKFRFQAAWLTNKGLRDVIQSTWDSDHHFMDNIPRMAETLGWWNKSTFGNILYRKKNILARLGGVDWITSGDRNTAYYHAATTIRKARNTVKSLKDDAGNWITQADHLQNHVRDYFITLFSGNDVPLRPVERRGGFPQLQNTRWDEFDKVVSIAEVHKALTNIDPFKAPGPDGFHAAFYQRMWDVVGDSVFKLVKEAFDSGSLPPSLNDTLLVLIHKIKSPETVRQFRPISLCNVSYKIITKTITNRLKGILPDYVGPYQSSFVKGRQISDNILIYQEIMHTMRSKKGSTGFMAIKLDFEKAYDRLSWDFIRSTLTEIGFNENWIKLIMHCIQTPRMSLLWNGDTLPQFSPSRGIRQGDTMSPAIFVLCMEQLSQLIEGRVLEGVWKGIRLSSSGPPLSHLCFADDLILFSEASPDQVEVIRDSLDRFCDASGQKISYKKSQVFFSKNVDPAVASHIANSLNLAKTENLGIYLGVQSAHGRTTKHDFSSLLDRIKGRMEGWKTRTLSLAGRITLAKSVLNSIPTYAMQTAVLPAGVCAEIEKCTRRFIWEGNMSEGTQNKLSLVNWDTVTKPKVAGGLGIFKVHEMNMAFMAKLGWRLQKERDTLWVRTLTTKYSESGCHSRAGVRRGSFSNAWKGILAAQYIVQAGMTKVVRGGRQTNFWMDKWIDYEPLNRFLRMPLSLSDLYVKVRDLWEEGRGWKWELFTDLLPENIMSKLHGFVLSRDPECDDEVGWDLDPNGDFSINSAYASITPTTGSGTQEDWLRIWKLKVPNRICVFIWLVQHGRILTNVERARRHITSNTSCLSYAGHSEDCEHLFRHCVEARAIWSAAYGPTLDAYLRQLGWREWLTANLLGDKRMDFAKGWPERFSIRLWWIWKWRNDKVFNARSMPMDQKIRWIAAQESEIQTAFSKVGPPGSSAIRTTTIQVSWQKPSVGCVKVNVDGSWSSATGRASCGGVIRDHDGNWRGGFVANTGICSIDAAETWAVCDSRTVVDLLDNPTISRGGNTNLIDRCRAESNKFHSVEFRHVFREQNRVADALAKEAMLSPSDNIELRAAPDVIKPMLYEDSIGVQFNRRVLMTGASFN